MIEFRLLTDFTDDIAAGLDRDGKAALKGLQKRGLSKVEIPFDTVGANIKMTVGKKEITIKGAHGVRITGKANLNDDDASPNCEIRWRVPFEKQSWAFFGENFGQEVSVRITNQQTVMSFRDEGKQESEAPPPKSSKRGSKASKPSDAPNNVTPITSAASKGSDATA